MKELFHVMSIDTNIKIQNSKRTLKKYEQYWKNVIESKINEIGKIIC